MSETDKNEIDVEPDENSSSKVHVSDSSSSKPFKKINHELSEKELSSTGVRKLLLSEIAKLEFKVTELLDYKNKFHAADKERSILIEKQKHYFSHETLFSLCLTLGALLVGLTPSITGDDFNSNITLGVGILLIASAILSKVLKK